MSVEDTKERELADKVCKKLPPQISLRPVSVWWLQGCGVLGAEVLQTLALAAIELDQSCEWCGGEGSCDRSIHSVSKRLHPEGDVRWAPDDKQ